MNIADMLIIPAVKRGVKKRFDCKEVEKITFLLDYKKDQIKTIVVDRINPTKFLEKESLPESLSENIELADMISSRVKQSVKFDSVDYIRSVWDFKSKKIDSVCLYVKDGKKLNHSETIKL